MTATKRKRTKAERQERWQTYRAGFTIVAGSVLLIMGVRREDAAMMTVGGGLVGFAPAAKGP